MLSEFDRIRNGNGMCFLVEDVVASIVFQCWPNVESIVAAVVPRAALLRFVVDDHSAACGAHWSGVEVARSKEVLPRGLIWLGGTCSEEVEGELYLWEQEVPSVSREVGCRSSKDGKKVILEGAYGTLCSIASVYIWWYKLECTAAGHDCFLDCATDFVVKNVSVGGCPAEVRRA